ncbi:MAG: hypothetical protein FWF97_00010 [Alphaproteobacteria bacterium]|nr:hypothetical protein [Alphaproteobacteria bacterium]
MTKSFGIFAAIMILAGTGAWSAGAAVTIKSAGAPAVSGAPTPTRSAAPARVGTALSGASASTARSASGGTVARNSIGKYLNSTANQLTPGSSIKVPTAGGGNCVDCVSQQQYDYLLSLINELEGACEGKCEGGKGGEDAREIIIRNNGTYLQWQYEGDLTWNNLVSISELQGDAGPAGADGKSVEMRVFGGFIQYRLTDGTWNNLLDVASMGGGETYYGGVATNINASNEINVKYNATHLEVNAGNELNVKTGSVGDGSTGLVTGGNVYNFVTNITDGMETDIAGKEDVTNKLKSTTGGGAGITSGATDTQYASGKAVYEAIQSAKSEFGGGEIYDGGIATDINASNEVNVRYDNTHLNIVDNKLNVKTGSVADGNGGLVTGGDVYNFVTNEIDNIDINNYSTEINNIIDNSTTVTNIIEEVGNKQDKSTAASATSGNVALWGAGGQTVTGKGIATSKADMTSNPSWLVEGGAVTTAIADVMFEAGVVNSVGLEAGSADGTVDLYVNTILQDTVAVPGVEVATNKLKSTTGGGAGITSGATDTQYASGKAVYEYGSTIETNVTTNVTNDLTENFATYFGDEVNNLIDSSTTVTNIINDVTGKLDKGALEAGAAISAADLLDDKVTVLYDGARHLGVDGTSKELYVKTGTVGDEEGGLVTGGNVYNFVTNITDGMTTDISGKEDKANKSDSTNIAADLANGAKKEVNYPTIGAVKALIDANPGSGAEYIAGDFVSITPGTDANEGKMVVGTTYTAGSNINISSAGVISSTGGGSGDTYTAGDAIAIDAGNDNAINVLYDGARHLDLDGDTNELFVKTASGGVDENETGLVTGGDVYNYVTNEITNLDVNNYAGDINTIINNNTTVKNKQDKLTGSTATAAKGKVALWDAGTGEQTSGTKDVATNSTDMQANPSWLVEGGAVTAYVDEVIDGFSGGDNANKQDKGVGMTPGAVATWGADDGNGKNSTAGQLAIVNAGTGIVENATGLTTGHAVYQYGETLINEVVPGVVETLTGNKQDKSEDLTASEGNVAIWGTDGQTVTGKGVIDAGTGVTGSAAGLTTGKAVSEAVGGKADKVTGGGTDGKIAGLNGSGNLTSTGIDADRVIQLPTAGELGADGYYMILVNKEAGEVAGTSYMGIY